MNLRKQKKILKKKSQDFSVVLEEIRTKIKNQMRKSKINPKI